MSSSLSSAAPSRIAVTGIGLVTPLGLTRDETWQGLLAGRQAVDWLPNSVVNGKHSVQPPLFGARVPLELADPDRMISFAKIAAREAVAQAGLSSEELREAACIIGTSKIEMQAFDRMIRNEEPLSFVNGINGLFCSGAAAMVAGEFGCQSASLTPVAACATGLLSLIQAATLIRSGHCLLALAGATDSSLHAGVFASYRRLGVLARPGNDPGSCCRPFDETRMGFAVGEGAAVMVLEDWNHALARGADVLAEWVDGIFLGDASDLVRTDREGRTIGHSLSLLLSRNDLRLRDISAVNVHGTGTRLNDAAEAAALRSVFGSIKRPIYAFGLKGAIGHLMGAAGAVETAACLLALTHGAFPGTVNHKHLGRDLGYFPCHFNNSLSNESELVLKLSLGFGGTVAAALMRKFPR